jgi:hypothetical protein
MRIKPHKDIEFFVNDLGWDLEHKKFDHWFVGYSMTYRHIRKDLGKSLKLFFDKRDVIHSLVSFVLDMDGMRDREATELYFSNQMQIMETYGNIKSKGIKIKGNGSQTKKDIDKTLSLLPDKVFDKIFIHYYKTRNFIPCYDIFGHSEKTKKISEYRDILKNNLLPLRNFITHPCKDGKYKNPKNEKLYEYWYKDKGSLNLRAISALSTSINKMLRWFVLQEIGLEKYFELD